jgi:RNA polymerase sigma-70 factor (ECF subfamily)
MDGPRQCVAEDGPGPDALALFWRENRAWIAAVLHAHRPREVEVDDLLQEVALALVRHAGDLDLARARPWLRRVAINCSRDAGRRAKVRRRPVPSLAEPEAPESAGLDALGAVMTLPMDYREPLLLSLRGLPQWVIAEVMEVPVTTVETRLVRARRMVREALAPAVEERVT